MSQLIDRRSNNRHKGAVNRQRFLRRFKSQLKKAIFDAISKRSITDIEHGEKISLPTKNLSEPSFQFGLGGKREVVFPGNQEYSPGDRLKKPPKEKESPGNTASPAGEGCDEFSFQISQDEFLELFFEDLELPHLTRKEFSTISSLKNIRAGFTSVGTPSNINIIRSLKGAIGRRLATTSQTRRKLKEAEERLESLLQQKPVDSAAANEKNQEVLRLKKRLETIPYIDPFDLRFNHRVRQSKPNTCAVMFCLMDVSGSMDEIKKDIAKRFFILLYLFLKRNYEKIELVFIRHHTTAKQVSEHEFFYSRETGGTVVSSALELMRAIIKERYPPSLWNIYGAQASDGDNWNNDSPRCLDVLKNDIMPFLQYFAYIEILPRHHQSLWEAYQSVKTVYPNFAIHHITKTSDIYPVFRELFKRNHPAISQSSESVI